jgi:hypothetical protein
MAFGNWLDARRFGLEQPSTQKAWNWQQLWIYASGKKAMRFL